MAFLIDIHQIFNFYIFIKDFYLILGCFALKTFVFEILGSGESAFLGVFGFELFQGFWPQLFSIIQ